MKETFYAKEMWLDEDDNLHVITDSEEYLIFAKVQMMNHHIEFHKSQSMETTKMTFVGKVVEDV